jgi:hypothetical protein
MPFFPGSKPEQIPTWGQIRALFNLRWLRMWFPAVYTIAQLQQTRFLLARVVVISDSGKMGLLWRDETDSTTADDGQDCILTADDVPVRYKRRSIFRRYTPTSGTDTSMETGSMVYDNDFLHVKTGSSTIERIPFRLQTQGNVVASTAQGGASDANHWARIGTVVASTTAADFSAVLAFSTSVVSRSLVNAGIIRIVARRDASDWSYAVYVDADYKKYLGEFRLVKVSDSTFEMWVQKSATFGRLRFTLLTQDSINLSAVTYVLNAPWQSATPTTADTLKDTNAIPQSGTGSCTTATRPATTHLPTGYNIWDTTISKQMFWNGSSWRDAMGAAV